MYLHEREMLFGLKYNESTGLSDDVLFLKERTAKNASWKRLQGDLPNVSFLIYAGGFSGFGEQFSYGTKCWTLNSKANNKYKITKPNTHVWIEPDVKAAEKNRKKAFYCTLRQWKSYLKCCMFLLYSCFGHSAQVWLTCRRQAQRGEFVHVCGCETPLNRFSLS